jgi:pimeloyl-ACP methyl ester carboxylesterase
MVESNASAVETEQRNKDAGTALLDRIGPAILLTHSQAGSFGWLIADTRPILVKAILAIEPAGPPFENPVSGTGKARAYGLTDIPIAYDPPIRDANELAIEREDKADAPDLSACWTQKSPTRQLVNLKNIPVMIITAEASSHAVYDHCTAKYLNQAGVKTDFIRLRDLGIHGNGHAMMIEKNNLEIALVLDEWVLKNVR